MESNVYKFKDLDNVDRQIIAYIHEFPNAEQKEIADHVGMNQSAISKRLKRPAVQKYWREQKKTTDEHMLKNEHQAAIRVGKIIRGDDSKLALDASKFALQSRIVAKSEHTENRIIVFRSSIKDDGTIHRELIEQSIKEDEEGDKDKDG